MCGARGRFGKVGAGVGCCVFPVSPCPPRVSCAVCGGLSRLGVPYPCSLVRHSMRSVRSTGSVLLPFSFSPVSFVCACAHALVASAPPPPPSPGWCGARTSRSTGAGRWYQARDSALLAHGLNYRGISARCLEPDHVSREKLLKAHTNDKQPNDLIFVFQCRGAPGAGAFVAQLMELQPKLELPQPDHGDKVSNWNTEESPDPGTPLIGKTPTESPSPTCFPTIGSEGPVPTDKDLASQPSPPPLTHDTHSSTSSHPLPAIPTSPNPKEAGKQPRHPNTTPGTQAYSNHRE